MIDRLDHQIKWTWLADLAAWTVEQAIAIQQIPAPTFDERLRAEHVADVFRQLGLQHVEVDALYNVYGLLPGKHTDRPGVMISAHTDTVFPAETDLRIRREGDLIYGVGLGDNSIGTAGILALASGLKRAGITPERNLWLVAPSREEGLGDLGGMRVAFAKLKSQVNCVINVEGLALGHVYHAGIAVRRLKITARTEGGHSWLHFGRPSAIHTLMQLGARIGTLPTPQTPRTTYNIGLIEGGQSINSIASSASMWLDMRSEARQSLSEFEFRVRQEISALSTPDVEFDIEIVGDRPAGQIAQDHPLVRRAQEVLQRLGLRSTLETGSTDGNIPLSEDCPAVTIGITYGGNAHRLDEYIEVSPVQIGIRQIILLALASAKAE